MSNDERVLGPGARGEIGDGPVLTEVHVADEVSLVEAPAIPADDEGEDT